MIERIDLIEKEAFSFTFAKLTRVGMGIAIFLAALYGIQVARVYYYNEKIKELNAQVETLKEERKKLLKSVPTKLAEGAHAELQNIFLHAPVWATLIKNVAAALPGSIWITGFKASSEQVELPKSGSSSANAPSTPSPTGRGQLSMNGIAPRASDINQLVNRLKITPWISEPVISGLQMDKAGFLFSVHCDIVPQID